MTFSASEVRPLTSADLAACLELAADRDWAREARKWNLLFDVGQGYGVDAPGGGLAASVVVTPIGQDLAAVSMVLVAGRFERQGLGKRVMARAMTAAGDRTVLLYSTKFGRGLYESLGFVADGGIQAHYGVPAASHERVSRPVADAELPALYELDAEIYGTDREPLLKRMIADAEHVHVVTADDRITGYALGTHHGDTAVIGPVFAADAGQARSLIAGVAAAAGRTVRVDLDVADPGLAEWAQSTGLVPKPVAARMVHNGRPLPGDASRRFAPFGPALG